MDNPRELEWLRNYKPSIDDLKMKKPWTGIVKSDNKMSWNIDASGTIEEVVRKLEEQSSILDEQSKEEYDSALPHLIALVKQNIGCEINLTAYGHGDKNSEGNFYDRTCSVELRAIK